jgi:hypothetical protein
MDQDQLLAIFNESGNGGAGDVADNGVATDDADATGDLFSTEEEQ